MDRNKKNIYGSIPQKRKKTFFYLKRSVKKGKAKIMIAIEEEQLLGYGGIVSNEEYLDLQKYALGTLFYKLSNIKIIKKSRA